MGTQLEWNERYNIGVEIIDREHKKLFSILNKLLDFGHQEEKSHWVCQEAVKYFKEHAIQHFADEEDYMASIHYEGLKTHRHIHKNFRERTLPALEKELERTDYSEESIRHFLSVCAGWLIGHTLIEDHAIVSGEQIKHWENLLPDEEQAVMGQTVASLLHSMFQVDPRLLSDCYGGEKFGDGIYYRLIAVSKEKKRWEFFLIFEEKFIAGAIGGVMNIKSKAVRTMLMHAAGYVARQFVERIKRCFPSLQQFQIKEEQLLSYEQFQMVYEKQSPQFSMLFDTGKGYFAYCMTSFDQIESADGEGMITENAMEEVRRYLEQDGENQTTEAPKKKLLIVDDSEFILHTMQELFGNDYEVTTARSGMSAIRDMTLDRPDLILLDYEMPVCNGKQVLEMIRSDREFNDTSVIFLTNKVDKESVKKALALRPEGYLSKSLPPEAIKNEVNHFFEQKKRQ
ncbi:MAG: response regulator [Lachnospiraceae bacterium]|nr:response regulator [Lachnospiraceae bacterium]